ncbi:MAG: glucoamylase family protein [Phycisphaerales bacterium]
MKTITRAKNTLICSLTITIVMMGCSQAGPEVGPRPDSIDAEAIHIQPAQGVSTPPFVFDTADKALLDEITQTTFWYFWEAVCPDTGMVYDRTSSDVVSVAGVGFQLAALPIGVERGWITREQGVERAAQILNALENEPSNRKAGLFYHFINPHDASARRVGRELVVSTIDSALLFSGMMVAGEYFEGDIARQADRLFAAADWTFFLADPGPDGPPGTFLSLGWKPTHDTDPTGDGALLPYYWLDSGDEHRLAVFMGLCAPNPDFRLPPSAYWNLRRQIGWHDGQGPIVYFPYSGALFTSFFAHLFIDYASLGSDNPGANGSPHRVRVNWWENARRTVHLHRDRAIQNPLGLTTIGPNAWGFSASDGPEGYLVSQQFPEPVPMRGAQPGRDFPTYTPSAIWGDGVIAPYAPGTCIMFEPELAIAALRFARNSTTADGSPGVWRGSYPDGWGFADAYRLDENGQIDWIAEDFVAISQGPLLLGIENAQNGLIWQLFMAHEGPQRAFEALGAAKRP